MDGRWKEVRRVDHLQFQRPPPWFMCEVCGACEDERLGYNRCFGTGVNNRSCLTLCSKRPFRRVTGDLITTSFDFQDDLFIYLLSLFHRTRVLFLFISSLLNLSLIIVHISLSFKDSDLR